MPPSSSGLGHYPLKVETVGSNPTGGTNNTKGRSVAVNTSGFDPGNSGFESPRPFHPPIR